MKKNIEALYIPIAVILFHIIYLVGSIVLNYSFVGFYYAIFLRTWTDPVIALSILFIGISLAFFLKNYFFSVLGIFISSVTLSVLLQLLTRTYSFNGYLLEYIAIIRFFSIFTGLSIILLLCNFSSVLLLCNFSHIKKLITSNFKINNKIKVKEDEKKPKKFQNIIGLVIGLIIFFIIFLYDSRYRFYDPESSIMGEIAHTISNFIFNTSSWRDSFWWICAFIYFYCNWKYRSCIGYYAIKLSQTFYKKI